MLQDRHPGACYLAPLACLCACVCAHTYVRLSLCGHGTTFCVSESSLFLCSLGRPRVTGELGHPSHPSHFFVLHMFTSVLMTRMRPESPRVAWLCVLGDTPRGMQSLLQGLLGCRRHPDHQKPSPRPVGSPVALGPSPGLPPAHLPEPQGHWLHVTTAMYCAPPRPCLTCVQIRA